MKVIFKSQYHVPKGLSRLCLNANNLTVGNLLPLENNGVSIERMENQIYTTQEMICDPVEIVPQSSLSTTFVSNNPTNPFLIVNLNSENNFLNFNILNPIPVIRAELSYPGLLGGAILLQQNNPWLQALLIGPSYYFSEFSTQKEIISIPKGGTQIKITLTINSVSSDGHPFVMTFIPSGGNPLQTNEISVSFYYDPLSIPGNNLSIDKIQIIGRNLPDFHILDYLLDGQSYDFDDWSPVDHNHHHHSAHNNHHHHHGYDNDDCNCNCNCGHQRKSTTITTTTTVNH